MSNKMQTVIRGVMRDHRITNPDIFHPWNSSSIFKKEYLQSSYFWTTRQLGFDEAITGLVIIIGGCFMIFLQSCANKLVGVPSRRSENNQMNKFEMTDFYWGIKTNPNSHYNALYGMYTTNPLCGLRELPKRPWVAFKDPENTMKRVAVKHNRENWGI